MVISYSIVVIFKIILHNNMIIIFIVISQNVASNIGGNEDYRLSMRERPSIQYYTIRVLLEHSRAPRRSVSGSINTF